MTAPGRHRAAVVAVVVVLLAGAGLACTPKGNPIGTLDVATRVGQAARFEGWAFDPDTAGTVLIEVRAGATVVASQRTGSPLRPDVAAAYPGQAASEVGFSITTPPLPGGSLELCVWARNKGVGISDTRLGCRTFLPTSFAILGDSLAVGVDAALRSRLGSGWPGSSVASRAEVGSPLSYAVQGIGIYKASTDVLVVSSGANNLLNGNVLAELTSSLDASAGARCVVWPTVSERIYNSAQWATAAQAFNQTLRAQASIRPWIHVADWAPAVNSHPEYTGGDGLHHTPAGTNAFADLLAATIAAHC